MVTFVQSQTYVVGSACLPVENVTVSLWLFPFEIMAFSLGLSIKGQCFQAFRFLVQLLLRRLFLIEDCGSGFKGFRSRPFHALRRLCRDISQFYAFGDFFRWLSPATHRKRGIYFVEEEELGDSNLMAAYHTFRLALYAPTPSVPPH